MTSSNKFLPRLLRGLGHLPLPILRRTGDSIGRLSYRRRNRMAQVTRRNIDRCFADWTVEQRRQLEKASLRHTGMLAAETLGVWTQGDEDWLRRRIKQVHGLDHAQQQLAQGKGLIVLAPHLGNWEVLGLYLTALGPVTSLYDPPRSAELEELVRSSRERSGARLVPTDRKGVTALLQALKQGQISGILPDQAPHEAGGRFSEFFGLPTFTMTLVHKLIQRTGCRAVFGFAKRVPDGFEIIFKPAPEEIYNPDEATGLRALNKGVEACVREAPEQYQWEYKRFKKPLDGVSNFYEGID